MLTFFAAAEPNIGTSQKVINIVNIRFYVLMTCVLTVSSNIYAYYVACALYSIFDNSYILLLYSEKPRQVFARLYCQVHRRASD